MGVRASITIRIIAIVAVVAALVWFFFLQTSKTWLYEEVVPGVLYRASMRTEEEFTAAALDARINSLTIIAGIDERQTRLFDRARYFGHRNKMRVLPLDIDPGADPSDEQISDLLSFMQRRPAPNLVVDLDGTRAGKVIAAYRLRAQKLPLDQVLELADLKGTPPEAVEEIRRFARSYHAQLQQATPATAPAPSVAPSSAEE